MPNAVALTAEFCQHRRRATIVMLMFCGFSVGAALGGLIAAALIPSFGWQSVFLAGGLAPLLLAPVLAARLPESVRFLALRGGADRRVAQCLTALFPRAALPAAGVFCVREPALAGSPVRQLFRQHRSAATLLFWVVFFMSLLDLYFLSNWLPTVLNELGASVSLAASIGSLLQIGGIAGVLVLGRLVDRFAFRVLAITYLAASVAVAAIGASGHSIPLAALTIFCAGFCIVGGQTAANALAATYYPTAMRATGVGWALGVGRVGSIIGPLVGGVFLAWRWSGESLFLIAAVPALVAAAAAFGLHRIVLLRR